MPSAFPISGTIEPKAFPFLLMDLHHQGATGSLKVEGASYQKALYFRGGRVLFGSSNDPRDQLGAILVESGKLTPGQLEDVNTKVGPGNPLAKVLSESGLVNQKDLSDAARLKVERILSDLLSHTGGSFEFEDGVLPKGAIDLKLSTARLVVAATRRVADRSFAGRHVAGSDAVLAPTPRMAQAAEVRGETGGLVDRLDGRTTLREAARSAGLDEAEAMKVACGLLFLGVVEVKAGPPEIASLAGPEAEPGGFDLGTAADLGFGEAPAEIVPAGAEAPEPFAAEAAPTIVEPQPAPAFLEPPAEPPPFVAPEPAPTAAPVPTPQPEPFPAEADTVLMPSPEPLPFGAPPADGPSLDEALPPPAPTRPSKEDLAALDALLNAPTPGGSAGPASTAGGHRWEPRFGHTAGRGHGRRAPSRLPLALAGVALVAAVVGGGAWYFLGLQRGAQRAAVPPPHPATPPPTAAPVTIATPAPDASEAPVATPPAAAPETPTPPSTTAPATPAPTSAPTAVPAPRPTPKPPAPAGEAGLAGARQALASARLGEAASVFVAHARGAAAGSATVQLLVACSDETVQKAVANANAPELFILPVDLKGRACYRVCWGIYPSADKAAAGVRSVPAYFRQEKAAPRVVPLADLTR